MAAAAYSWDDEEEEEEEELGFVARATEEPGETTKGIDHDYDNDYAHDDEILNTAGTAATTLGESSSQQHSGLRLRRHTPQGPYNGAGVLGGFAEDFDDQVDNFALGSERIDQDLAMDRGNPGFDTNSSRQRWRQFLLLCFVLAAAWITARDRRPTAASFRQLREERYIGKEPRWMQPLTFPRDKSFDGRVAWSRYVEHGPIALGTVCLSVPLKSEAKAPSSASGAASAGSAASSSGATSGSSSLSSPKPKKLYYHRYLGIFGGWWPLPYLPQPGRRPNIFGIGVCWLGRCLCLPKLPLKGIGSGGGSGSIGSKASSSSSSASASSSSSSSASSASATVSSRLECWRFEGGSSAALNVVSVPALLLFLLWQFGGSRRGWLSKHATLSLPNLQRGRILSLFLAPFLHRSLSELFHFGLVLASTLDTFDHTEISLAVFMVLYLAGAWAAWIGSAILWGYLLKSDRWSHKVEAYGSAGSMAAQMMFLARVRPEAKFQFSLYMIPIPVSLTAWQSCFAHSALDLVHSQPGLRQRQILAHVSAWAIGWLLAGEWLKHAA